MATSIYRPISSEQGFLFLYILASICHYWCFFVVVLFFMIAILTQWDGISINAIISIITKLQSEPCLHPLLRKTRSRLNAQCRPASLRVWSQAPASSLFHYRIQALLSKRCVRPQGKRDLEATKCILVTYWLESGSYASYHNSYVCLKPLENEIDMILFFTAVNESPHTESCFPNC